MADVFISYSSEDRDRVRPLAQALQAKGFSVWWDRALAAGDDYGAVIKRELETAKVVIVAWSQHSAASPWVRDEAGLARTKGRLVPVLLDKVDIPLGFGTIHTEDLTNWQGGASAPEIAILAESIKARLEGRAPDAKLVANKRRGVSAGRWVSTAATLGGLMALFGAGFWGYQTYVAPKPTAPVPGPVNPGTADSLAQLLKLVDEGKITGEQAVALAKLLEQKAFEGIEPIPASAPAVPGAPGDPQSVSTMTAPADADVETQAAVKAASLAFDDSARQAFTDAAAQLMQDPDPAVRQALVQTVTPATRQQGVDAMWKLGKDGHPSAAAIWRLCGSMMSLINDPRAAEALEKARGLNPQDKRIWRMLSVTYNKTNRVQEAAGAALVGQGLEASAEKKDAQATASLEKALPYLDKANAPESKAFVLGQLGDRAAADANWERAEVHYREAVKLHRMDNNIGAIGVEASKLARAQLQQGEAREACQTLTKAKDAGGAVTEEEMKEACAQRPTPLKVRPDLVAPRQIERVQPRPQP
jgi:tetratricopeptide (TPR) repeat protein